MQQIDVFRVVVPSVVAHRQSPPIRDFSNFFRFSIRDRGRHDVQGVEVHAMTVRRLWRQETGGKPRGMAPSARLYSVLATNWATRKQKRGTDTYEVPNAEAETSASLRGSPLLEIIAGMGAAGIMSPTEHSPTP